MIRALSRVIRNMAMLAALWVSLGVSAAFSADAIVTDVRVGNHADKTRFVLEMTHGLEMRFFLLDNPYRVVMDFAELDWMMPASALPKPAGLFKTMRYGLYKPKQSRIVIETSQPVAVESAFYLAPEADGSQRFVLDLIPTARSTFVSALNIAVPVAPLGAGYARDGSSQVVVAAPSTESQNAETNDSTSPEPAAQVSRKRVIAIDAGHGGADPGAIGKSGVYEKNITITAARIVKKAMESTGRYRVVLTRDSDVFVKLRGRVAAARRAGAELFISLHADSIKDRAVSGASVYTLSEKASDKEAALLAEKENKVDLIGGVDLSTHSETITNILIDMAQRESMDQSARFAKMLVKDLKSTGSILSRPHRFAGFAVLKAPDMPSVLIELGFLSNAKDEKNLRSKAYLKKIATALLNSADQYFARIQQANVN